VYRKIGKYKGKIERFRKKEAEIEKANGGKDVMGIMNETKAIEMETRMLRKKIEQI
jgi:hypothetical protein